MERGELYRGRRTVFNASEAQRGAVRACRAELETGRYCHGVVCGLERMSLVLRGRYHSGVLAYCLAILQRTTTIRARHFGRLIEASRVRVSRGAGQRSRAGSSGGWIDDRGFLGQGQREEEGCQEDEDETSGHRCGDWTDEIGWAGW